MGRWIIFFLLVYGFQNHGFGQTEQNYSDKYEQLLLQTKKMQESLGQFVEGLSYSMQQENIFESNPLQKNLSRKLLLDTIETDFSGLSKAEKRRFLREIEKNSLTGLFGSEKKAKKFYELMLNDFEEINRLNQDLVEIYSDLSGLKQATQSLLLENLVVRSNELLDRLNEFLDKIDPRLISIINQHAHLKFPESMEQVELMEISKDKSEAKDLVSLQKSIKLRRSLFLSLAFVDLIGLSSAFFVNDAVVYTSMIFAFKNMAYIAVAWYLIFESRAQHKLYKLKKKIDPRIFQLNDLLDKMNQRIKAMDKNLKRISCVKSGIL